MTAFLQAVVDGIITGSLYALLGLAFVLIYRSTHFINFAQGEMATLTTFVGWSLLAVGVPYAVTFAIVLIVGAALGGLVEAVVIRPALRMRSVSELTISVGLFLVIGAITMGVYGGDVRQITAPVTGRPFAVGGVLIPRYGLFVVACVVVLMLTLWAFFRYTSLGLSLRATASSRYAADLVGIRTSRMLTTGWGLAGAVGGAAGLLLAPIVGLSNQMMLLVLVSALSAAVLGGLTSPVGAVVGGVVIGVLQNLVGAYLDDVLDVVGVDIPDANSYREIAAAALLVGVLVVRPGGLFGRPPASLERV